VINIIFTLSNKDEDKTKPSFGRIATFGHVLGYATCSLDNF